MAPAATTRRTLLTAAAGALAGGELLRPGGALAALARLPAPALWQQRLGALGPAGATVALSAPADLLGVQWQGAAAAHVQLRFRTPGGGWSRWASASAHAHAPEAGARSATVGDPVWAGGTRTVQLRADRHLRDARLHLVRVGAQETAARAAALGPAAALGELPAAGPGAPPIIARAVWAGRHAPPRVAPEYGAVRMAFVHHTESPNGYAPAQVPAMLLAIYAFHRYVKGWNDIGYNFVVDLYGRIFEARAGGATEPVVGAQAGGFNLLSTGVAVLGSFQGAPPSPAARAALERLLAWKLALHGVPAEGMASVRVNPAGAAFARFPAGAHVALPRIAGHRDGDATDCPGDALYGELGALRAAVARLAPRPVRATLALAAPASAPPQGPGAPPPGAEAPPPPPAAPPGAGAAPALAGTLRFIDGAPIAGARVLVQARRVARRGQLVRELAVAEALTDGSGAWSLPLAALGAAPARALWLRALCPGSPSYGAAVSEPLRVRLSAPAPAPPQAPAPTAPAAAPPAS